MNKNKVNKIKIFLLSTIVVIGILYFFISQYVTKTLETKISQDDYKQSMLNLQTELNNNLGIVFNNVDIENDPLRKINQDFGLIGIAELSNDYLYGYEKHKDIYNSIKVTPIDGESWYFYDLKDEHLDMSNINQENLAFRNEVLTQLQNGRCLIYSIGRISSDNYETNQKNVALSLGLKLLMNAEDINNIKQ